MERTEQWSEEQRERLERVGAFAVGAHEPNETEMCVMEACAYIAGEPWSDAPSCFARPHGVVVTETTRLVEAFEIAEPTLREALEMDAMYDGIEIATALGCCTVPQLIATSAYAQRELRREGQREHVHRERIAYYWRTMRAANLVLAARAVQKIGGPMYA